MGKPLSNFYLKGPKSTSSISSLRIEVSWCAKFSMSPKFWIKLCFRVTQLAWIIVVRPSSAFFFTSGSVSDCSLIKFWVISCKNMRSFVRDPECLTLRAIVPFVRQEFEVLRLSSKAERSSEGKSAERRPKHSATIDLIDSSGCSVFVMSSVNNSLVYACKHLLSAMIISRIVLINRYFCRSSDNWTSPNTFSEKNWGLPIVRSPSMIEVASLTSSFAWVNKSFTSGKILASFDKSCIFPTAPRVKIPAICYFESLLAGNYQIDTKTDPPLLARETIVARAEAAPRVFKVTPFKRLSTMGPLASMTFIWTATAKNCYTVSWIC